MATALTLVPLVTPRADAAKAKVDPRTYDVRKKAFGKSFKDWTVEWWQWAESIPAAVNPLLDETGEFVEVGQRGPVWFLAGVQNKSGTATRTATIPTGKALFFPVINGISFNVSGTPRDPIESIQVFIRDYMAALDVSSLHVTLDGSEIQGVQDSRIASPVFEFATPANNTFVATGGYPVPRGVQVDALSDGYWVMLRPLSPGQHSIRLRGTVLAPFAFTIDVTYGLTVVDHNRP